MITRKLLNRHREAILDIAQRYGAQDVRIFGSVARGDTSKFSDLDLIVRFEPGRSLFDHGRLLMDLQDLLGIKVDVISEGGLRPRFRRQVMKEAVSL
jgi:predicted nucleotidyltransferase